MGGTPRDPCKDWSRISRRPAGAIPVRHQSLARDLDVEPFPRGPLVRGGRSYVTQNFASLIIGLGRELVHLSAVALVSQDLGQKAAEGVPQGVAAEECVITAFAALAAVSSRNRRCSA